MQKYGLRTDYVEDRTRDEAHLTEREWCVEWPKNVCSDQVKDSKPAISSSSNKYEMAQLVNEFVQNRRNKSS